VDLPRLEDLSLSRGSRVLVRVDCNVPMHDGQIVDDLRITSVLPTIEWLRNQKVVVVLAGHLGRPNGVVDPQLSMAPVAKRFGELLHTEVVLAPEIYGFKVEPILASAAPGGAAAATNLLVCVLV